MTKIILWIFTTTLLLSVQSDNPIKLEKIIFHTSMCLGNCPIYHLEVDQNKTFKLYAEKVYKDPTNFKSQEMDSSKVGYFVGKLDAETYTKLITELNSVGLDSLKFDGPNCCDAQIKTLIVYYNGKRKYLKSMFPPQKASNLISILYEICKSGKGQRTSKQFTIES